MSSTANVFFYGGLINPRMRDQVGLKPQHQERALLTGFELQISPYVNLVRSVDGIVYGMLMRVTHTDLQRTYMQLKAAYLPHAVLASDSQGQFVPALCYIVPEMVAGQAEADHVQLLATAAAELDFPHWYLKRIRSFLPHEPPIATVRS